jgi:hypothetical protein
MLPFKARADVLFMAAVAGLLAAACASTSIVSAWVSPEAAANKPRKLLIVGVTNSDSIRRTFEDEFANQLKVRGLNAIPSYSQLRGEGRPTQEAVVAAIRNSGADAVLVTQIKGTEMRTDVSYRYDPMLAPGGYYGFYSSAWANAYTATPTVYQYEIVNAETKIWNTVNDKLLFSVLTRTFDPSSPQQEIPPFVSMLVEQMAKGGLI